MSRRAPREAGRVTPTRLAALEVLRRVRGGELLDRALEAAAGGLEPRDRGWTQELAYGTMRLRGRIDHLLGALLRGGTATAEPEVLDILRLGAYQLLEMGSVPAYAAISQSQELARAVGAGRAVGLVAGVLHGLQRRGRGVRFPDPDREPAEHLASWGSHPRWLVDRWIARWGVDSARTLVEANNRRPELFIRPLNVALGDAAERLAAAGVATEAVPFSATTLRVLPPAGAADALAVIPAVIQDPAAALVVEYADVPPGAYVIDLCAAPGGKALGLAERARTVVAADLSERRLERLRENASRTGAGRGMAVLVADGRHPPFAPGSADLVLLDAPCTGTGTLRRHPDGRWRLREDDLAALAALQRDLIDRAAVLVRSGGWLLYSTCSLETEENHAQVEAFLKRAPGWRLDPPAGAAAAGVIDGDGFLSVLPQVTGYDGSFAARLRRDP